MTESNTRSTSTLLLVLSMGIALSACGGGDDDGGGAVDGGADTPDGMVGQFDAPPTAASAHFFAAAEGGKVIAYTFDGTVWSTEIVDVAGSLSDITGGDGYMVVGQAGGSTPLAMYSTDGLQWTDTSPTASAALGDVAFGNDTFVATTSSGAHRYHNNTWSAATTTLSPAVRTQHSLAFIEHQGGRFVWLDANDNEIHLSSDGDTWTMGTIDIQVTALTYGAGRLVALGNACATRYSDDGGATFMAPTTPVSCSSFLNDAVHNGTRYVAVGSVGRVMYSDDGIDWTLASVPFNRDVYGVAWNADLGLFMAVGRESHVWTSADGMTWQIAAGTSAGAIGGSYRLLAVTTSN